MVSANPRADLLYKYAALLVVAMIVLLPLLATALGGFKSLGELRTNAFGWPRQFDFSAYLDILTGKRFWRYLLNSAIITFASVALTVTLAAMTAFVLAMVPFRGRDQVLTYFTIGLMFRQQQPPCRFSSRCAISACSTRISASSCQKWRSGLR